MTLDQISSIEDIREILGLTDQRATESVYYALQAMEIAGQTPAQQNNETLETTVIADTTGVDITTAILMDKYRK